MKNVTSNTSEKSGFLASARNDVVLVLLCFAVACAPLKKKTDSAALNTLEQQAIAEMNAGNFDAATEKLNTVLAGDAQRWKTLNALGVIQSMNQEFSAAYTSFASADAASPNNTAVLNNWGLALAMEHRYDEAIARLMQAVEASENNVNRAQPEMNLAMVYALSGNDKPAEMILRRYLSSAEIKKNLKSYAKIRNNRDQARQTLQKAYDLAPQEIAPPL